MEDKKAEYLDKLRALAAGTVSPREVSEWAIQQQLQLESNDVTLNQESDEILELLQISGAVNENNQPLYSAVDFNSWLKEWTSER